MRMVACGQTKEQMPHWMQSFSSQTGMSTAMLRFSYCEVAVGKVPSIGMCGDRQVVAEAGDDLAGDILDELRGVPGNRRRHRDACWSPVAGTVDFVDVLERLVDGGVVHGDDLVARLAVALLDGALDLG